MGSLNLRVAAITVISLIALVGSVLLVHGVQSQHLASSLHLAAQKEREKKEYPQAIKHFNDYLIHNPTDKRALLELGMTLAESHHYGEAFSRLEEVLRTGAEGGLSDDELHTARRKLVDVAMAMNRWQDAEPHLKSLLGLHGKDITEELPALKDVDPELEQLLAQCEVSLAKDEEGVLAFKDVIRRAPNQIESYSRLFLVLRYRLKRETEADQFCELMLKNNPKSTTALHDAAHYMQEMGKLSKALEYAERNLALSPDDPKGLWNAAYCHMNLVKDKPTEAERTAEWNKGLELVNKGLKLAPTDLAMYMVKVDMLQRRGRIKEAIEVLQEGRKALKGTPGYPFIIFNLAAKQIESADYAEAQKQIQELVDLKFREDLIEFLRARISFFARDWIGTRTRLEKILPQLTFLPAQSKLANYMIALCYGVELNQEKQLAAFRRVVAIDPYFYPARDGIADILLRRGDIDGALKEYQEACKHDSTDVMARISYARTLIRKTAGLPKNEQNWKRVDLAIEGAKNKAPDSVAANRLFVDKLIVTDHLAEAEEMVLKLREKSPNALELYTLPVLLAMQQEQQKKPEQEKDWKKADKYLDEMQAKFGNIYAVRAAQLQYFMRRYPDEKCKPYVEKLGEDIKNLGPAETAQFWTLMVRVALSINDLPWARSLCQKVAALDANDVQSRYRLIELALHIRDNSKAAARFDELDRTLDELKKITDQGYLWQYGMAVRRILENKNDPESLRETLTYLAKAREMMPTWWPATLLAGTIEEQLGDNEKALADYLAAINHGGRQLDVIRRAVHLLLPQHKFEEAKKLLNDLNLDNDAVAVEMKDLKQDDVEVDSLLNKDLDATFKKVSKSVSLDSKDYRDHLWRGQVIGILARRAKTERPEGVQGFCDLAQASYLKAIELAPKAEECYILAAQFFAETGQRQAAGKVIAAAEQNLTGPKSKLALAICYGELGMVDEAQNRFDAVLKTAPEDVRVLRLAGQFYLQHDKFDKAEPILRQIVKLQSKETVNDVNWARRRLAEAYLRRKEFKYLCMALDLIEENLHSSNALAEDRRIKAHLLLSDPRRAKRKEAVSLLIEMADRDEAQPDDRFQLAQLYLKEDAWKDYVDQMLKILALKDDPQQMLHRIAFIQVLIDHKEFSEAEGTLKEVETVAANHPETVSMRASLDVARAQAGPLANRLQQFNTVVDHCLQYLDNNDAEPKDRVQRLLVVASMMEGFSKRMQIQSNPAGAVFFRKQAENLYTSYLSQNGARKVIVVGFLARQGKTQDAIALLTQIWETLSIEEQSAAVLETVQNGTPVIEQYAALAALVDMSLNKHNRPSPLLLRKAELCALQKKDDAAEALFREVLARDPRNYAAMNNLAMLLAHSGQRLDDAQRLVEQALDLIGPLSHVLDSLAVVEIARKEPLKAIAELDKAIADDPQPLYYMHVALAQYDSGNKPAAKEALDKARLLGLKPETLDASEKAFYERLRDDL